MKVGLAQINTTVADLEGNVRRCLAAVDEAESDGAEVVVLPEMAVPGCAPQDLLLDATFVDAVEEANRDLARRLRGSPPTVVGTVGRARTATAYHPGLENVALVLSHGLVQARIAKRRLAVHDVFLEPRWFVAGTTGTLVEVAGRRTRISIGDDGIADLKESGPRASAEDLLVCPAAMPFNRSRRAMVYETIRRAGRPVVWVNLCGGNDELIYPGGSLAVDNVGGLIAVLPIGEEAVRVVDLDGPPVESTGALSAEEELFTLLVLGIRDFAFKNGLERAVVGLSGGIDSALVAALATAALGPSRVVGVAIPSRFTDPRSTMAAAELAYDLGIDFGVVDLEQMHSAAESTLSVLCGVGTTSENIQARLRMVVLMAHVNAGRGFLLSTSNKTELALGYGTLYGDLAGALCPIGDLTKLEVYALARWVSGAVSPIPAFILNRAPSAELAPAQVDPFDYEMVSPAMEELVSSHRSDAVLRQSEHKRRQAGIVLKVKDTSFGRGRMVPVTRR